MYQFRVFHNIEVANVWLSNHRDISIIEYKVNYTPYNVLAITILYKSKPA